jgi:hypothetical protein
MAHNITAINPPHHHHHPHTPQPYQHIKTSIIIVVNPASKTVTPPSPALAHQSNHLPIKSKPPNHLSASS